MPRNQFVVPQFLDIEPRIIGPITARQFILMLVVVLLDFVVYRIFGTSIPLMLLFAIPITGLGAAFAFGKVNGQPLHVLVINGIQTVRRPAKRVWDKHISDAEIKVLMHMEPPPPSAAKIRKSPIEGSRLSELALVVNTGGVYVGEE